MLKVSVTGPLRMAVGGNDSVEVVASTIREMLNRLSERYPALADALEQEVAVSVNGEIYRDNWDIPIPADAEVFLIPRIQGG